MNYRVMLVDDEEEVRAAIERKLDWNSIGFEVVATAENGQEALEKSVEFEPDVVMTDIQMPFMNGLDFSKKLKEQLPATKVVIFSGYDDFEYAQEAIKIEAEEYILKPIDSEELKGVFSRIKVRLDDELNKRRNIENLEHFYQESFPLLRQQFLIALLEGSASKERLADATNKYGLSFNSNFYCVSTFRLSCNSRTDNRFSEQEGLLALSLNEIAKEKITGFPEIYCFSYLDRVVVICGLEKEEDYGEFVSQIDIVCKFSAKMLGVSTYAGVGNVVASAIDIQQTYRESKSALSYRIVLEDSQAIPINDVEPENMSRTVISDNQINALVKQIKMGENNSVILVIDEMMETIKKSSISIHQIELVIVQIYLEMIKLAKNYDAKDDSLFNINVYGKIQELSSIEEIRNWLIDTALLVRGIVKRERMDSTKLLMENAKSYIAEHYAESDMSIDRICSHLGVSATYFSSLFKKDTGNSFVTYLTNVRMEKAIELLNTTDEKTYIIAEKIGYDEPNYFSYVFKKAYGISPSKYRANNEK